MITEKMNLDEVKAAFHYIAENMIASKETLTRADQAIGDGDHGIGMARGFEAVNKMLAEKSITKIEDVFFSTGTCLLASIGGASGAIFGSFFMGAAKGLKDVEALDSEALGNALTAGLEMVKKRGNAQIGDKTMVDALEPAVIAAKQNSEKSIADLVSLIYSAAKEGMEKTKSFVAKIGKAKTLGERTIGFADPGAISISLIFQFLDEFIQSDK